MSGRAHPPERVARRVTRRALPPGRLATAVAMALTFALAGLAPSARAADEAELDALRAQIQESRQRVGAHERQERALLEQLEESDRLSAALAQQVRVTRKEADEARRESEQIEQERARARERLDRTRRAMEKRVVALYKAGSVGPLRFVFASSGVQELLSRVAALETFVAYDADLVTRYRDESAKLEKLGEAARVAAFLRDDTARRLEARSQELEEERALRRRLLSRAREDRTQERALLVELEKAARALEATVAALGETPDANAGWLVGKGFERRRGALASPLEQAEIAKPFGRVVDEEFQTETFRKGVEFAVAGGESVRAVAPGVVRFAGWFRGYGKLVIIDQGDEYFTVLGHLADIVVAVGDSVAEGDTLGTAGDTGSLAGPSLYFEIRHGAAPLDPSAWLGGSATIRAENRPVE